LVEVEVLVEAEVEVVMFISSSGRLRAASH